MPRVYKPIGPSSNKAEAGPSSIKSTTEVKPTEDGKKKGNSSDK